MSIIQASLDLTPFDEQVEWTIKPWGLGGYSVKGRVLISRRWGTQCEYLETQRIFGHKGNLDEEELKKEFATAFADIHDKRLWVFKANHGLLDKDGNTVRFKA